MRKDQIVQAFGYARELVRRGDAKGARKYVLILLDGALGSLQSASTIMMRVRTEQFLDQWIAVSRDLYEHGITDFVLKSFGLEKEIPALPPLPEPSEPAPKAAPKETPKAKAWDPSKLDPAQLIGDEGLRPSAPADPFAKGPAASAKEDRPEPAPREEDAAESAQGWCAEIFEHYKDAVVCISVVSETLCGSGTGFIISPNGYLLTNDHVVYNSQTGSYHRKITMSRNGEKKKHKLEVLFSDKKLDIALCRFDPAELGDPVSVRRITDYSALKQGADCLVIGNAFGMGLAPFSGLVRFTKDNEGNLVYTAPSNPGDSGAPVFNRQGECIGINKSRTVSFDSQEADGYANATPMDSIDKCLARWTEVNDIVL